MGIPKTIEAQASFFDNGANSSCSMAFKYDNNIIALLKSTLLEDTPKEAIFYCEKGTIKINKSFFAPTTVTIVAEEKAEIIDFNYTTIGYNYEIIHFNQLLRQEKTESNIMSFEFSLELIKTLDRIRHLIGLKY
ncbi:hypothetical protein [Flavivirga aquatica]|uniref:hypothetical protein n=1 Tax=Flavivirga aquatica TaxID=1849968 RepID=UPI0026C40334